MTPSSNTNAARIGLSRASDGRLIAELRSLKSQRSARGPRIAKALEVLENTTSPTVRNAAALALADLRARDATDRLVHVLARRETSGSRGSLLYALNQLNADVPVLILAEIVAEDPYEAREEALFFLDGGRAVGTPAEFAEAVRMLDAASTTPDAERLHAVQQALKLIRLRHPLNLNAR